MMIVLSNTTVCPVRKTITNMINTSPKHYQISKKKKRKDCVDNSLITKHVVANVHSKLNFIENWNCWLPARKCLHMFSQESFLSSEFSVKKEPTRYFNLIFTVQPLDKTYCYLWIWFHFHDSSKWHLKIQMKIWQAYNVFSDCVTWVNTVK